MKKYLITGLMALATAALFAACGSNGGNSGSTPAACYNQAANGFNTAGFNAGTCGATAGCQPGTTLIQGNLCCPPGAQSPAQCMPSNSGYGGSYGGNNGYYGGNSGYQYGYGYSVPYPVNPYPQYPNYYGSGYSQYPNYYGNQGTVSFGINIPF